MLEHDSIVDLRSSALPAWCALHTRHQHERTVASILSERGFEVFLPTYRCVHRWKDRNKQLILPLFPGYLFLRYEMRRRLQILSTPGINGIVNAGTAPAAISDHEIDGIQRMVDSTLLVEPHPFLNEGDLVRVKAGPLAGLEGIVLRKKDGLRLILSITMLGRSAAAEIDACMIERLSPARPVASEPLRARAASCGSGSSL